MQLRLQFLRIIADWDVSISETEKTQEERDHQEDGAGDLAVP